MPENFGQIGSTHIPCRVTSDEQTWQEDGTLQNMFTAGRNFYQLRSHRPVEWRSVQTTDRNLARLRRIRTWSENWNGEGAPAPNATSLDIAERLLCVLAYEHAVLSVGLDADSRPMFNLRNSLFEGHIVVEAGGELSFFFSRDEGEVMDGFDLPFDGHSVPSTLKHALSRV